MSLLLLTLSAAIAGQLTLSMDTRSLTLGETAPVELQVVDGSVDGVPDLPVGPGLTLGFQGQNQSRVMVNFKTTRIVSYDYSVTATREGSWTVGPVTLEVDGKPMTAPAITVNVAPRSAEAKADRDVSATLSDTDPYLGQVVVYRFRFEHRGDVLDANWTPPTYDGFVREQQAEVAQHETSRSEGGDTVKVQEIDVPLVAAATGSHSVSPALLRVQMPGSRRRPSRNDPFAGTPFGGLSDVASETLTAPAVPVKVRPLPEQGRPADFSGLVGRFTLTATPSTTSIKLGETVTMDITVQGDGTLAGLKLPPPTTSSGFRAYDDSPEVTAAVIDTSFQATAHLKRALVPEREGTLTVPPVALTVFNPETGNYETLQTQSFELEVLPGESDTSQVTSFAAKPGAGPGAVQSLGEDILPAPKDATVRDRTLAGGLLGLLVPPALPALGLVGLELSAALSRRRASPWVGVKARLASLPSEPGPRLAAIEQLFREAAGLKLGRPAPGLDRAALAPLGEAALTLYADLEKARYGGLNVDDLEPRVRRFIQEVAP